MPRSHDHISCQQVVEMVSDYLEHALEPHEAALFEEHLNFCEGCVIYVEQLRATVAASARVREADIPPAVRDNLMTAFRNWRRS